MPIIAGTPNTKTPTNVYKLSGSSIYTNPFKKYMIKNMKTFKNALKSIYLQIFFCLAAIIKATKKQITQTIITEYFKNNIKSPFNIMNF